MDRQDTHWGDSSLNMRSMEIPSPFHTQTSNAFEGYNLFNLEVWSSEGAEYFHLITDMNGTVQTTKKIASSKSRIPLADLSAEFINSSTVLLGQKDHVALWNLETNRSQVYPISGHHEYEYNPLTQTFLTLQRYDVERVDRIYVYDRIVEYNANGTVIWTFDTDAFIPAYDWCPYQGMGRTPNHADLTHANSLFWDFEEDVIYLNLCNMNTFYKIDHTTGKLLWGLGEHGNFYLYDQHGRLQRSLWYHGHSVKQIDTNSFIIFDNDLHNQTNPLNQRSRILEITINETTMTAHESWNWTAPPNLYTAFWGDASHLPNGNFLGVFVNSQEDVIESQFVEIDRNGQIVWILYYPYNLLSDSKYGVYRLQRFRRNPILNAPADMVASSGEDVTVTWNTWYNFRTKMKMNGTYRLFLNRSQIEMGTHIFDKFWRPTNLTTTISALDPGTYNFTLALSDEGGHTAVDSVTVTVTTHFSLIRQGPSEIELGDNASVVWNGNTPVPLNGRLTLDGVLQKTFLWNGSLISYPLNSLEVGTYLVTLQLFNMIELAYEDDVIVTIYPAAAPLIHSFPPDQSLAWNHSLILSWALFDYTPASWSIFINSILRVSDTWEIQDYQLDWSVPLLDEGRYNITLAAYDRRSHWTSKTMWLTMVPPRPPVITTIPLQTTIQWGQPNTSLSWEIHGGTHWTLWKNGTAAYRGEVTTPRIEIQIEDWQRGDWWPGTYNLTMQITEEGGVTVTSTYWLRVFINLGDAYADFVISEASMWYAFGEQALGPPDGNFANLFFGYGNGHLTLDMGLCEEIINGPGADITVYATRRSEYAVFGSNNLLGPTLIGNQVSAPLMLLGEGLGNASFDLASVGIEQARYIQIVYLAGEEVQLDAVVAMHFNQPPSPAPNYEHWMVPISGIILVLSTMVVVIMVQRRKR